MTDIADVVVVGAGPAGSCCATLLARHGHRVILLDQAHFPRPKACAEFMSPGVISTLRRLDLPWVLESSDGCLVPGMEIISPRGSRLRVGYVTGGRRVYARTMPRQIFDAALVNAARHAGAEVREGFLAKKLLFDAAVVAGVQGEFQGSIAETRARLTVIADGSRSRLSAALGLSTAPRWPVRLGLVAHFRGQPQLSDGYGQMHVSADGYCGIAPLPGDMVNVAAVTRADAIRRSSHSASVFLDRWIQRSPELTATLEGCDRLTPVRGIVPIGSRSKRASAPGALLVGDAASFFDPFTGEGIHRALCGAELVAEVGHAALDADDVSAVNLRRYDVLRKRAFREKSMVTALIQAFVQYPRLMEYALPRLARRPHATDTLGLVLGDVVDASEFLRPRMLWSALRP